MTESKTVKGTASTSRTYSATCGCGQFLHEHDDQACRTELWTDMEAVWRWVELFIIGIVGIFIILTIILL